MIHIIETTIAVLMFSLWWSVMNEDFYAEYELSLIDELGYTDEEAAEAVLRLRNMEATFI